MIENLLLIFTTSILVSFFVRKNKQLSKAVILTALLVTGILSLTHDPASHYLDALSAFLIAFCLLSSLPLIVYSKESWEKLVLYETIIFSCFLLSFSENFFLFYVLFETIIISSSIAVYNATKESLKAAEKYLIINLLGSTLTMTGIALNFSYTSSLNPTSTTPLLIAILILMGLIVKSALFPFHVWLPDVYSSSSIPTAAVFSGIIINLGFFGIFKYANFIQARPLLLVLAAASMLYAGIRGLTEWDIRKLIAYSSIIHVGYITLGISAAISQAPALLHMFNHGIAKTLMFLSLGLITTRTSFTDLRKLKGYARNIAGACFLISVLAVAGIPPTNCFVSEVAIIVSVLDSGKIIPVAVMLASYLLAMIFYLRIIYFLFFSKGKSKKIIKKYSWKKLLPVLFLTVLVLIFGIFPSALFKFSEAAAGFIPAL